FVTTTRVTHATPAALYSHVNHRDWECDSEIPKKYQSCIKDIARQLVEDSPGRNFKVIMGGGWNPLGVTSVLDEDESCIRQDGLNIVDYWTEDKRMRNLKCNYVNSSKSLMSLDIQKTDCVLGIFGYGHVPYKAVREETPPEEPSLVDMTSQAIRILQKEKEGYVLMLAMMETSELDDAIKKALSMTDRYDTLIIVTADHSHAFTINGYPKRGNDILGFANKTDNEFPYETLTYANGPSYYYHRNNDSKDVNDTWRIPSEDRGNIYYQHFAPIYLEDETHAGEDVPVYALGPQAHLLQGVHEQNYIAHVVSYASCIGPHSEMCQKPQTSAALRTSYGINRILIAFIFLFVI
ncbi:hypothetical protein J437_LFUL013506, partial [Ladona fulva]